ncbi:polysaccharide pyruvyl transferase family protein [Isoptericola croceus]|uniref:polysaccharide pyruvyl transferase family protein n=1 Tax=Isoptericola croceus TaxID=3031406 RepID=UPI0023F8D878|nr:polysaccharide pyruvyl transferase family protein [Isoptericola croceus]
MRRRTRRDDRRVRVGLLGQFGYQNFGNEASLDAVLDLLRTHGGAMVEPVVLTDAPEAVRRDRGVEATSASAPRAPRGRWRRTLGKLADLRHAWLVVGRLDAVLVPGTGILEGHAVNRWGPPLTLTVYGIVARLRRRPYLVLSVGADRRGGRAVRVMQRTVVRAATYLSTRDDGSAAALGHRGRRPAVVPDLAFGLSLPERCAEPGVRPTVAVGVVRYDWYAPAAERDAYTSRSVRLVELLVRGGAEVLIVVGDEADDATAQAVADRVHDPERVHVAPVGSVQELESHLVGCRAVVAVRYHNLVAAIRAGVPAVSLGYGPKQRWLMEHFFEHPRSYSVEEFDPDAVAREVLDLASGDQERGFRPFALHVARMALADQERCVATLLGLDAEASERETTSLSEVRS